MQYRVCTRSLAPNPVCAWFPCVVCAAASLARPSGVRGITGGEREEAAQREDIAVFPLAFPLIAGPGALTSVVLLMGAAEGAEEVAGLVGAVVVVIALTLAALLSSTHLVRLLGVTGTNVIGRVLGVVLAALAAQFVLDGISHWLPYR